MSSFSSYRNEVKYNYILNATIHINKEFHDVKSIESLIDNEDFLQIYFPQPGLGRVYVDVNIEKGFLFFRFGITEIDKKEDFTSKELKEDIIEMILSLNKNIDYFKDNNIERGDIKLHVIKDKESYDKKLVNEGKLTFVSDMTEVLKLTDEGKVEYYINNGLKESFDFSKQKVNTLCESLVQQGAWLEESDDLDYNNLNSSLEQTEKNIKTGIEKVDELQDLKDELMDKVDTLVNESYSKEYLALDKELDELIKRNADDSELNDFIEKAANNDNITNQEYTKLQYKAQDTRKVDLYPAIEKHVQEMINQGKSKDDIIDYIVGQRRASSIDKEAEEKLKGLLESKQETWVIKNNKTNRYLSEKSNNSYYWVTDINKARKFSSYEDVFDFIERESKFGNNGADNWEEIQLNESANNPTSLKDIKAILSDKEYKKVLANYLLSYTDWISDENIDDNGNMKEDPLEYQEKINDLAKIDDLLNCVWRITGKNYLFKESYNKFPSTENTKKRLCYNDIKGLNLVDNYLDEDQIKWIEENISNKYHFEDGFKNIYDLLELDDNDHFISIDEYIDNIQYMNKLDNEEGDNKNV